MVSPAQAQDASSGAGQNTQRLLGRVKDSSEPVYMSAQRVEYLKKENVLTGCGNVEVRHMDMSLRADEMEYHQSDGKLVARGNVVLEQAESRLTGERLEMDLNTRLGVLYQGRGFFAPSHYFSGEKIGLLEERQVEITEGSYSACDQEVPDWQVKTQYGLLKPDDYIRLKHFVIYIRRIPVFWFPEIYLPVRPKRTTGFLFPSIGYSNQNGALFKNRFFWAISSWMDATFYADYLSKRGMGVGLDFNYALTEDDGAALNAYYIRDTGGNNQNSNISSRDNNQQKAQDRWKLKLDLKQHFDPGMYVVGELDLLSDRQFDRQYSMDLGQRRRQVRDSYVWLTKNWDAYSVSGIGEYITDLYQAGAVKQWRQPELKFFAMSQPLEGTPLWFNLEGSAADLKREGMGTEEMKRLQVQPRLYWPVKLPYGAVFTPQAGYRQRWYDNNLRGESESAGNYDLSGRLEGPTFSRIFSVSAGDYTAVKHSFSPYLAYSYIPSRDQGQIIYFDHTDRIPAQNLLKYGLQNRLWTKDNRGQIREWLEVDLNQAVDMREDRFSPLNLNLAFRPMDYFDLTGGISYNFDAGEWQRLNLDVEFSKPGLGRASVGWRYTNFPSFTQSDLSFLQNYQPLIQNDPYTFWYLPADLTDINFLLATGTWELSQSWTVGAGVNYNLDLKELVQNTVTVDYHSQCWGINFNYINRFDVDEFNFNIILKNIGSVM